MDDVRYRFSIQVERGAGEWLARRSVTRGPPRQTRTRGWRPRSREGIAAAKAAGRYKGRPANKEKHAEIMRMHAEGVVPAQIALQLNVARSTVYKVIGKTTARPIPLKLA